jgi:hypothetical protein
MAASFSELDPLVGVGLIDRDDLRHFRVVKSYLKMQRASSHCHALVRLSARNSVKPHPGVHGIFIFRPSRSASPAIHLGHLIPPPRPRSAHFPRATDLGGKLAAPSTPEAYGKFVQAETVRWAKMIRDANINLD